MSSPWTTLREALGVTQAELGKEIGVSGVRVCQLEKGDGTLKGEHLLRFMDRYRIDVARLGLRFEDFVATPKNPDRAA